MSLHHADNVNSQGDEYPMGLPFIKSYKALDYSGEAQNWAFTQNTDGVIFIANTIGFIEYDGVSWRQFKPDNDGVPLSFAQDSDGHIYTGGTGFIGKLESDSTGLILFKSLASYLPDDFFIDFVWTTHYYQGKIYFQNQRNIISWDGNSMTIIETPDKIELLIKTNNHLYVDTKSSLYELVNGTIEPLQWANDLSDYTIRIMHEISADSLLIGTYSQGLYLLTKSKLNALNNDLSIFFKKNLLPASLSLSDGKILIGTKKAGAIILNEDLSAYYRITESGGLSNNDIKNFYLDKDDNIWIGTDNGFSKLQYPIEFTFFASGLGVSSTVEEIRLFQNNLVIGSFLGVYKLIPRSNQELLGDQPYAVFEKIEGTGLTNMAMIEYNSRLLIGTTKGTQLYDGRSIRLFDTKEARKFYQSQINKNVIFAGYRNGCDVLLFDGDELIERIPVKNLNAQIRGIAEDTEGRVWMCSLTNGVYRASFDSLYQTTTLEYFSEDDGLPSLRDNLTYRVDDKVIFTTHKGIFVYDDKEKRFIPDSTFGEIYANYSRFVYAFYFDEQKNAWIHAFRKRETALSFLEDNGIYKTDRATFTTLNKMQIYEIYKEPGGAAWFGGSDGLARYEPSIVRPDLISNYATKVRKVIVNGDSLLFLGHHNSNFVKPVLASGNNELRFENAALYFDKGNQYQYFLEGFDVEWSSWSEEPFKIYTNLNHGEYNFMVRARNVKGSISLTDSFEFRILPPWHLTWWFLTLSFISITLLLIYVISYFSTRKLIRRVEELVLIQKAQTQRERISRDLHDNVGSNLTYIISSLDYLTYKSGKNDDIASKMNNLSEFTRDTLHQLRDTIWHIGSGEISLDKFVKRIQEMCLRLREINDRISFDVIVEGDVDVVLPPLPALNLYRVIQESVNNAFKHATANKITVGIKLDSGRFLNIKIVDDGAGFILDEVSDEEHYGLANMENRMKDVGGTINIASIPEKGTTVEVTIGI